MPPLPKTIEAKDADLRFRWWSELQLRLERIALFYDADWNEIAGAVLESHCATEERKLGASQNYPIREIPRRKYADASELPRRGTAELEFLTLKLQLLQSAMTPEGRALIASVKFEPVEYRRIVADATARLEKLEGEHP